MQGGKGYQAVLFLKQEANSLPLEKLVEDVIKDKEQFLMFGASILREDLKRRKYACVLEDMKL